MSAERPKRRYGDPIPKPPVATVRLVSTVHDSMWVEAAGSRRDVMDGIEYYMKLMTKSLGIPKEYMSSE